MVAWRIFGARTRLRNCKTHPPLPFCLLRRFGENTGEVMLPAHGGRNDFGPRFVSLFVNGVYAYGEVLTEIPEMAKTVIPKMYFGETPPDQTYGNTIRVFQVT